MANSACPYFTPGHNTLRIHWSTTQHQERDQEESCHWDASARDRQDCGSVSLFEARMAAQYGAEPRDRQGGGADARELRGKG